jgi:BirA family transcriptional regulator, biotin operon repressor / biotin---[acetyl-CoA-carboxylase] ligase
VGLDPADIRRSLQAKRLGGRIECLDETDSTNTDVAAAGRAGAAEGLVVIADSQRRGRGRLGRQWISPPGLNLYCSVLLRPQMQPGEVPLLTLVAGVAVADAVAASAGAGVSIKWPNDVLLDGRKVAGILTEMEAVGGKPVFVVIGIGVNLNSRLEDFPPGVRPMATSIASARGADVDRALFAARLLNALDARYESLLRDGFSALLAAWSERDALRGRRIQVRVGDEVVEGVAAGLGANGRLQMDTPSGLREIVAGDVSVIDGYRSA